MRGFRAQLRPSGGAARRSGRSEIQMHPRLLFAPGGGHSMLDLLVIVQWPGPPDRGPLRTHASRAALPPLGPQALAPPQRAEQRGPACGASELGPSGHSPSAVLKDGTCELGTAAGPGGWRAPVPQQEIRGHLGTGSGFQRERIFIKLEFGLISPLNFKSKKSQ